jgi:hypothetical protein
VEDEEGNETEILHHHPTIAEVAECWELRDNQGTWTSFKYPGPSAREQKFYTPQEGADSLEVIKHFEVRYNYEED